MKRILLAATAVAAIALSGVSAKADLVFQGFAPDFGVGFGDVHRLLTLQANPFESGTTSPTTAAGGTTITNNIGVDTGADKTAITTVGALNWTTGGQVRVIIDFDQTGGSGITLDTLSLRLFNGTTLIDTFSIAAPINFSAAQLAQEQGNGKDGWLFTLNAAESAKFTSDVALFGTGLFVGTSSTMGCSGTPTATCQISNDGPDSVLAVAAPVPGPIAGAGLPGLFALGMVGLAWFRRKRRVA